MNCKICGAPLIGSSPTTGSFVITPTCKCGKIRSRERIKHMAVCDAKAPQIQMVKNKEFYEFLCMHCKKEWTVTE